MEPNEQPFAPTLAHKLGDVPHVSGLLPRIAQLSGAGERVAYWLLKVAVERGASHYRRDFDPMLPVDLPAVSDEEIGVALCLGRNPYNLDALRVAAQFLSYEHESDKAPARPAPAVPQYGFCVAASGVGAEHGEDAAVRGDLPAVRTGVGVARAAMHTASVDQRVLWTHEAVALHREHLHEKRLLRLGVATGHVAAGRSGPATSLIWRRGLSMRSSRSTASRSSGPGSDGSGMGPIHRPLPRGQSHVGQNHFASPGVPGSFSAHGLPNSRERDSR